MAKLFEQSPLRLNRSFIDLNSRFWSKSIQEFDGIDYMAIIFGYSEQLIQPYFNSNQTYQKKLIFTNFYYNNHRINIQQILIYAYNIQIIIRIIIFKSKILTHMIKWALFFLMSLTFITSAEDFQTIHMKHEMMVDSFAFSQNQKYMVVSQNFYITPSNMFILPHLLFENGEEGFRLVSKEGISQKIGSAVKPTSYGKIQISKDGAIFVSNHADKQVRIFQNINGLTRQIQTPEKLIPAFWTSNIIYKQLSQDGRYLMTDSGIYEWNGEKFVFYYRNEDSPPVCSDNYRMSPDGKFILQYNGYGTNLSLFLKNAKSSYSLTSIKYQPSQTILQKPEIFIGKQKTQEYYTILLLYNSNRQPNNPKQQVRYYELNLEKGIMAFKHSINLRISDEFKTYLTKNGIYFGYTNSVAQSFQIYGKNNGRFEYIKKFWNFSKNASDIYISQDFSLAAVAIKQSGLQLYNKSSQQIAFFIKCKIENCAKCSWINACAQCNYGYTKTKNVCVSSIQKGIQQSKSNITNTLPIQKAKPQKDFNTSLIQQAKPKINLNNSTILQSKSKNQSTKSNLNLKTSPIQQAKPKNTLNTSLIQQNKPNKIISLSPVQQTNPKNVINTSNVQQSNPKNALTSTIQQDKQKYTVNTSPFQQVQRKILQNQKQPTKERNNKSELIDDSLEQQLLLSTEKLSLFLIIIFVIVACISKAIKKICNCCGVDCGFNFQMWQIYRAQESQAQLEQSTRSQVK